MKRARQRREYCRLLENLRAAARREERDWAEEDWRRALRRATAGGTGRDRPAWKPRPAWAWAYAAVMVLLLCGAALAVRSFFRAAGPTLLAPVETVQTADFALAGGGGSPTPQNQLAVTLISGESGLRVYWYFDKEFDWEGETP